jgi:hypothetical protein
MVWSRDSDVRELDDSEYLYSPIATEMKMDSQTEKYSNILTYKTQVNFRRARLSDHLLLSPGEVIITVSIQLMEWVLCK